LQSARNHILGLSCLVAVISLAGCSGPPDLHPITGKVTLGGKPYKRLIVYFRPKDKPVNEYNLGVGETDKKGELTLRTTAGNGLAPGVYRVSFSCIVTSDGKSLGISDEKADDDRFLETEEIVPEPYSDDELSPVEFEVKSRGENRFDFDIPAN
jgi:hypothetical protein